MALVHTVRTGAGVQNVRYSNGIAYILTKNTNGSGSVQNIYPKIKIIP